MKYKTVRNTVAGLRNLASFIEEHGLELPSDFGFSDPSVRFHIYASSDLEKGKRELVKSVRVMKLQGVVHKEHNTTQMVLRQSFGPHVKLSISSKREAVCTPRLVGTREVEEQIYVRTGRKVTEDIVEWDCDPLLA